MFIEATKRLVSVLTEVEHSTGIPALISSIMTFKISERS